MNDMYLETLQLANAQMAKTIDTLRAELAKIDARTSEHLAWMAEQGNTITQLRALLSAANEHHANHHKAEKVVEARFRKLEADNARLRAVISGIHEIAAASISVGNCTADTAIYQIEAEARAALKSEEES